MEEKRGGGGYREIKYGLILELIIDFELGFNTGSWGSNNEILCSMFKWYIKFKMWCNESIPINAEFLLQGMNKGQSLSFQICVQNLFLLY